MARCSHQPARRVHREAALHVGHHEQHPRWPQPLRQPGGPYPSEVGDLPKRATVHVDNIHQGADPGDLPVEQPAHFQPVLNLQTARSLGIGISRALLLRADHVIECGDGQCTTEPCRRRLARRAYRRLLPRLRCRWSTSAGAERALARSSGATLPATRRIHVTTGVRSESL